LPDSPTLGEDLDDLAKRFAPDRVLSDPVRFPRRYPDRRDAEAAALLAALFAYGNVTSMGRFLEGLLARLGPTPGRVLSAGGGAKAAAPYRFQTRGDVASLLGAAGKVLSDFGAFESAFCAPDSEDPEVRLEAFALLLRRRAGRLTPGLAHLLPLPSGGSACKRWRMFLRWVVRPDDGVDLGLWSCLAPSQLLVPVDTHIARIAVALGLTKRKTPDAAFSREVTASLARFCPEDPTRYDFTLAHLGISRECRGRKVESVCRACSLRPHCALGGKKRADR
jgi:uncharacterized protein (TIGR02757 family)